MSSIEGLVVKNNGSFYVVKCVDNMHRKCVVKGNMRTKSIKNTNPIAIGDRVLVDLLSSLNDELFFIIEILPRNNYIIRKSTNLSKQSHIIAANLDLSFLVCTISHPETSLTFIDRFISTAEAYSVPTQIVFNKIDLYTKEEEEILDYTINIYRNIGYKCHKISAQKSIGLESLFAEMKNKITLISGHSGVGKSTLINKLIPSANLKTSEISSYHNMGTHTTTFSEMIELPDNSNSYLIDTPGIKAFGTIDFDKNTVSHYFPEIFRASQECRFNNCTHIHEPGCNVKRLLDMGEIASSRYNSYLGIVTDDDSEKYRPEF